MWKQNGRTSIAQSKYAKKLIQKFNMQECKEKCTPLEQNLKFSYDSDTSALYRQMVGNLNYSPITRLDISYSISILNQFMANPLVVH